MPTTVRITVIIACAIGALVTLIAAQTGATTGGFTIGALSFFASCLFTVVTAPKE